jgi:hypothetical protein
MAVSGPWRTANIEPSRLPNMKSSGTSYQGKINADQASRDRRTTVRRAVNGRG